MKNFVCIFLLVTSFGINTAFSQGVRADRIEAEKVAFFTKRLELTSAEAEKFWPVYNDYTSRRDKLTQDRNALVRYLNQNYSNLSDKELLESSDRLIDFEMQQANLSKSYHEKFKVILPPSKLVRLYYAEVQFKTLLLNQLQNQRGQQAPLRRRNEMN